MDTEIAAQDAKTEEKEKVAQFIISQGLSTGHGDTLEELLKELGWQIDELRKKGEQCGH